MKKIILIIILSIFFISTSFANYKLEKGSLDITKKYDISLQNLGKEVTRKEFIEILYKWYFDYKKDRGINIDYSKYYILDNSTIFIDINLNSTFGKKLSYFAGIGAFSKNKNFNPKGVINQKDFITIMKRLRIIFSLQNCKFHKICEKEIDTKTLFLKGTYLKYISKILDKSLRKYYSNSQDYIKHGYKPYLKSSYNFPLRGQTLNGCYAFSVRNILKYKNGIGIYIPKAEKIIGRKPTELWSYNLMKKFDKLVNIEAKRYYDLDTIINSLQSGEPVAITYYLDYYSWKEKKYKKVLHIVAAYSFDEKGVWIAETVKNRRVLVPWEKVFNKYGNLSNRRMFKYFYNPKENWTKEKLDFERKNNILVGEY